MTALVWSDLERAWFSDTIESSPMEVSESVLKFADRGSEHRNPVAFTFNRSDYPLHHFVVLFPPGDSVAGAINRFQTHADTSLIGISKVVPKWTSPTPGDSIKLVWD